MKNASIKKLTNGADPKAVAEIETKEALLSVKGHKKLTDKIADNYVRLVRRPVEQRPVMILGIIENLLKIYNENTADMKNPYIETIRRPVVKLDKKTGELVERYESIRDACRKTGVYHGTIYHCVAHDRPKGYITAGGFKWMYESDWNAINSKEQEN